MVVCFGEQRLFVAFRYTLCGVGRRECICGLGIGVAHCDCFTFVIKKIMFNTRGRGVVVYSMEEASRLAAAVWLIKHSTGYAFTSIILHLVFLETLRVEFPGAHVFLAVN